MQVAGCGLAVVALEDHLAPVGNEQAERVGQIRMRPDLGVGGEKAVGARGGVRAVGYDELGRFFATGRLVAAGAGVAALDARLAGAGEGAADAAAFRGVRLAGAGAGAGAGAAARGARLAAVGAGAEASVAPAFFRGARAGACAAGAGAAARGTRRTEGARVGGSGAGSGSGTGAGRGARIWLTGRRGRGSSPRKGGGGMSTGGRRPTSPIRDWTALKSLSGGRPLLTAASIACWACACASCSEYRGCLPK